MFYSWVGLKKKKQTAKKSRHLMAEDSKTDS